VSAPPPVPPPYVAPSAPAVAASGTDAARKSLSGLALASAIIGAFEIVALLTVRIVVVAASQAKDGAPALALTFGTLGLVCILPTIAAIVLGHIALVSTSRGRRRGVGLAALGTGVGYVNLLIWGNRVLIAIISAAQVGDPSQFVPNNFWWA